MENIVRHRYWWFAISLVIIIPGLVSLFVNGLHAGIDFSGGALWDLRFPERQVSELNTTEIADVFGAQGFEGALVQISTVTVDGKDIPAALVRTKALSTENPAEETQAIMTALEAKFGTVQREELQNVGATVSGESTRSAVFAVLGASLAILAYLTLAFRKAPHAIRYGTCAVLAMLHDVILVLGVASILGATIGLEVDALFLTALLTIISFSVHDTIVVFDRIRENLINRRTGEKFDDIVNHSIVQTLPRSINTQLTSMFTLVAILLFGGESIRNFVLVMLIGLISGTFSSLFNAAQLLVVWENREWENWFRRESKPATV